MSIEHSEGEHDPGLEVQGKDLIHASHDSFDNDTARRKSTQRGGSPTAGQESNIIVIQPSSHQEAPVLSHAAQQLQANREHEPLNMSAGEIFKELRNQQIDSFTKKVDYKT